MGDAFLLPCFDQLDKCVDRQTKNQREGRPACCWDLDTCKIELRDVLANYGSPCLKQHRAAICLPSGVDSRKTESSNLDIATIAAPLPSLHRHSVYSVSRD